MYRKYGNIYVSALVNDSAIRGPLLFLTFNMFSDLHHAGLPRHGGAGQGERHANGLLDGWDGNPQTLQQVSRGWADPFRGQPIPQVPIGFSGNFGAISGFSAFSNRLFRCK